MLCTQEYWTMAMLGHPQLGYHHTRPGSHHHQLGLHHCQLSHSYTRPDSHLNRLGSHHSKLGFYYTRPDPYCWVSRAGVPSYQARLSPPLTEFSPHQAEQLPPVKQPN
ncbi:unnamed protein product [Arctogadus glacialis]